MIEEATSRATLRPLFDRIVVREFDPPEVRKSGLVVAGTAEAKAPPQEGMVLAVGPGLDWWSGAGVEMPVTVGDRVMFPRTAGVWVHVDEEKLLVLRVGELLGVLE